MPGTCEIESPEMFIDSFAGLLPMLMGYWGEKARAEHCVEEVKALLKRHLEVKYGGRRWCTEWLFVVATGVVVKS